eukprot:TRINITY_DN22737_c0_g1_i3.p1 TRINITY_DN22737_c0_g1~~TRINITY_DN22737_c0_g1_i3.p1  ORF type:complete len:949 (+),score=195.61 TRINITY_DN22737_c0_g1_i3:150-2996(+)
MVAESLGDSSELKDLGSTKPLLAERVQRRAEFFERLSSSVEHDWPLPSTESALLGQGALPGADANMLVEPICRRVDVTPEQILQQLQLEEDEVSASLSALTLEWSRIRSWAREENTRAQFAARDAGMQSFVKHHLPESPRKRPAEQASVPVLELSVPRLQQADQGTRRANASSSAELAVHVQVELEAGTSAKPLRNTSATRDLLPREEHRMGDADLEGLSRSAMHSAGLPASPVRHEARVGELRPGSSAHYSPSRNGFQSGWSSSSPARDQSWAGDLQPLLTSQEALALVHQQQLQRATVEQDELAAPASLLSRQLSASTLVRVPSASTTAAGCQVTERGATAPEGDSDAAGGFDSRVWSCLREDELRELEFYLGSPEELDVSRGLGQGADGQSSLEFQAQRSESSQRSADQPSAAACVADFQRRGQVWESQRHQRLEQQRRRRDAKEMQECSFQPGVRGASQQQASATSSAAAAAAKRRLSRSSSEALASRLSRPLPSSYSKAHAAMREKRCQEERQAQQCTFMPDLSKSASSFQLKLRSSEAPCAEQEEYGVGMRSASVARSSSGRRSGAQEEKSPDEWGHPSTNAVAPHMVKARSYVQQNVFSRLSNAAKAEALHRGRLHPGSDAQEDGEAGAVDANQAGELTTSQAEAENGRGSSSHLSDLNASNSFWGFLRRQNDCEESRRRRLRDIEASQAPTLQPEIDAQSRRLVEQRRRSAASSSPSRTQGAARSCSPSLVRSHMHLGLDASLVSPYGPLSHEWGPHRGPHAGAVGRGGAGSLSPTRPQRQGGQTASPDGPQPSSFRPAIHPRSSRRPPRGVDDMSAGDLQRLNARRAEIREQILEEERRQLPFAPRLNPRSSQVQGRLRVLESPEEYTARLAHERQAILSQRAQERQRRTEEDLAQCTFTPQINPGAPEYIRLMAEAHREMREIRELDEKPVQQRPEWR